MAGVTEARDLDALDRIALTRAAAVRGLDAWPVEMTLSEYRLSVLETVNEYLLSLEMHQREAEEGR